MSAREELAAVIRDEIKRRTIPPAPGPRNMYDLDGWVEIGCAESDLIRENKRPISSLTDPDGHYGAGAVYTEWATDDEVPILRDYRWSEPGRTCQHYKPKRAT